MTGVPVAASVTTGAGEAARLYLRMTAGAEAAVVDRAAGAACEVVRAFLGSELPRTWAEVPAPVAQAIVLLVAHLVEHRDAQPPPAAVTALLRPFRAMRLVRETMA